MPTLREGMPPGPPLDQGRLSLAPSEIFIIPELVSHYDGPQQGTRLRELATPLLSTATELVEILIELL
jgi:hypothetical protein